jgi:hypothetical protein
LGWSQNEVKESCKVIGWMKMKKTSSFQKHSKGHIVLIEPSICHSVSLGSSTMGVLSAFSNIRGNGRRRLVLLEQKLNILWVRTTKSE